MASAVIGATLDVARRSMKVDLVADESHCEMQKSFDGFNLGPLGMPLACEG